MTRAHQTLENTSHVVVLYRNAHQRGGIRDGDNIVYVIIQITILCAETGNQ